MLTLIILFLGYCGTFVFALSGARLVDWDNPKTRWRAPITAFLSSFGGGLTRDLLVLHCSPAILNAQIDLCILAFSVLCYALIYFTHRTSILNHAFVEKAITLLDGAGTAVFICMGADAAARCQAPWMVVLASGIITAIFGGSGQLLFLENNFKSSSIPLPVIGQSLLSMQPFTPSGNALPSRLRPL